MTDDFPAPRWQPNTYSLWPTILVRRTFAGCEEPNRALIALVEKMDREGDQLTATHWHGVVTFYDPRTGINMNSIRRDPYLHYHHTVPLVPGLLLIWPAFLSYFEHPNLSREPAVRVAFDIHLEDGGGSQ